MDNPGNTAVHRDYPKWTIYLATAVVAVLAIRAVIVPLFVWDMLHYPFDFFFNEGDTVFYTLQLIHHGTVYNNSTSLPILGNIYPPVYLWLCGIFSAFAPPSLESDRLYAVLPLIVVMATVAQYLRRAGTCWAVTAAAALLVPCCYSMSHFLIMPRCDGWTAAFCLLSLYFLSAPTGMSRAMLLGGLFSALALFTKQTAIFGLVAVHLTLLLQNRRKGLLAGAAAAVSCGVLLAISLWQFGPVMLEALTMSSHRTFDASRFARFYIPSLCALGPIAALALIRARTNAALRQWDLLDSYVIGHGLQSGLMLYTQSSSNYFLSAFPGLVVASALLTDRWLKQLSTERAQRPARFAFGTCAAALLAGAQLFLQRPFENTVTPPDKDEVQQAAFARAFLRELNEPVYSEHLWGVVADREPTRTYFVESTHLRCMAPGHLPPGTLEAPFRDRKFGRVMLFEGNAFHDEKLYAVILENYRIVQTGYLKLCFGDAGDLRVQYLMRKE